MSLFGVSARQLSAIRRIYSSDVLEVISAGKFRSREQFSSRYVTGPSVDERHGETFLLN